MATGDSKTSKPAGDSRTGRPVGEESTGGTRRLHERFDVKECRIQIMKGGFLGLGAKADIGGMILDMSATGLRFLCPERPALGARFKAKIKLGPLNEFLHPPVIVRWANANPTPDGKYIVGLEFEEIGESGLKLLLRLRELMRQPPPPPPEK